MIGNHLSKALKEIAIIMRSRRGFGMILYREDRQLFVSQPFDRAIRKVDVADIQAALCRERGSINLEVMVLRRDRHAASPNLAHRMIGAMMPKRQAACMS